MKWCYSTCLGGVVRAGLKLHVIKFVQSNGFIINQREDAKNQRRIESESEKTTTNLEGLTVYFQFLFNQQKQIQIQVYRNIYLRKKRQFIK